MNIHKYLVPASIAATLHVALLSLAPDPMIPIVIEVPLKPSHIPDPISQPPEEPEKKTTAEEPVKALRGEPAPVEIEEPLVRPVKTVFEMERTDPRPIAKIDARRIPPVIGDPKGVLDGVPRPPNSIFDATFLDNSPRAKVQIPPDYPYAKKQTGESGSVTVEFDVDTRGHVIRAEAIRYTDRDFVEPAVRAVRKWRFEPGRRDGKAVPFRMTIPIEFSIENER